MKVYIVYYQMYETTDIEAVFINEEQAQAYIDDKYKNEDKEWELDYIDIIEKELL